MIDGMNELDMEKANSLAVTQAMLDRYNQARAVYIKNLDTKSLVDLHKREIEIGRPYIPTEIFSRYYAQLKDFSGAITYDETLNGKLNDIRPKREDIDWDAPESDDLIFVHAYDWNVSNLLDLTARTKQTESGGVFGK